MVRNLAQKYGADILGQVYYDEFEVNGKKILSYIKREKYHNDRASSFVIKMDYNDILRDTTFYDLISLSYPGQKKEIWFTQEHKIWLINNTINDL